MNHNFPSTIDKIDVLSTTEQAFDGLEQPSQAFRPDQGSRSVDTGIVTPLQSVTAQILNLIPVGGAKLGSNARNITFYVRHTWD